MDMGQNHEITIQFLAEVPLRRFSWKTKKRKCNNCCNNDEQFLEVDCSCVKLCEIHGQNHECWGESCQQAILDRTLYHRIGKRYPPSASYRKMFVKWIMNKVESLGYTLNEDFYSLYVNMLSESDGNYTHKSHYLPSLKQYVVMQETKSMISGGTTGLVSWKGGMLLTEWMLSNRDMFDGMSLMELGCGCGFTGIVALKAMSVTHYTFTDCHQSVLSLLHKNLDLNDIDPEVYTIKELFWGDTEPIKKKPDYMLAADVVFDPDLIPDLVTSIEHLIEESNRRNAFVASTERNPTTYQHFLHELGGRSLNHKEIDTSHIPRIFCYDASEQIHLLQIWKSTT